MVDDELLLIHPESIFPRCELREMLDVFIVCVAVRQSVAPTTSSVVRSVASCPPHRARHALRWNHLVICGMCHWVTPSEHELLALRT